MSSENSYATGRDKLYKILPQHYIDLHMIPPRFEKTDIDIPYTPLDKLPVPIIQITNDFIFVMLSNDNYRPIKLDTKTEILKHSSTQPDKTFADYCAADLLMQQLNQNIIPSKHWTVSEKVAIIDK